MPELGREEGDEEKKIYPFEAKSESRSIGWED